MSGTTGIVLYAIMLIFLCVWSMLRFHGMAEEHKNRLKWYWGSAFIYALWNITLFIIILVSFAFIGENLIFDLTILSSLSEDTKKALVGYPAIMAAFVVINLHKIYIVKVADQLVLSKLLSVQSITKDVEKLTHELVTNNFHPSETQLELNTRYIEENGLLITEMSTDGREFETNDFMTLWRKVSTLLRFSQDCKEQKNVLTKADESSLVKLFEDHKRHTQLAVHVIRLMIINRQSDCNVEDEEALVSKLLKEEAEGVVYNQESDSTEKTIVTEQALVDSVNTISEFFVFEYSRMLKESARIASASIVCSRSFAAERLHVLKESGFSCLGNFRYFSLDYIISCFMLVFIVVFVLFGLRWVNWNIGLIKDTMSIGTIIKVSLMYSTACVVGAAFGSSRRLAGRKSTPWVLYLFSGIIAVCASILIHYLYIGINSWPQDNIFTIWDNFKVSWDHFYPWLIIPFSIAMCVSRLSRNSFSFENVRLEKLVDGIIVGVIIAIGMFASSLIHIDIESGYGQKMIVSGKLDWQLLLFNIGFTFVIGFVVGSAIVKSIRSIAHSGFTAHSNNSIN